MPDLRNEEQKKWDSIYASMQLEEETPYLKEFNQELTSKVTGLLPKGGKVLEAGCGAGWQSLALARTGLFNVSLLDFSTEALSYSKRLFTRENLEAQWIEGDLAEPGQPEYDLVFNAGVLEHYTTEQQVKLIKNMASRSRRYVLVLIPNQLCYWYWLWRIQKSIDLEWTFGKEVPQSDLSTQFQNAGVHFLGQTYLANSWTESFIHGLTGINEETRKVILEIHRSGLIPGAQTGYLFAALGSIEPESFSSADWSEPTIAQVLPPADLYAALSDALAMNLRANTLLDRIDPEKEEDKNRQILALQAELEEVKQQLNSIYHSKTWKLTNPLRKLRKIFGRSR